MINQLFIFKISANSTVLAEPESSPFSSREVSAAIGRSLDPRKLMIEERTNFTLSNFDFFIQKFDSDFLVGAVTQNCTRKKRFLYREFERVYARIKESGQGIIPSSAFLLFVREIVNEFNLQSNDPHRLSSVSSKVSQISLDVVENKQTKEANSQLEQPQRDTILMAEKQKNPFLQSDDEVITEIAGVLGVVDRKSAKKNSVDPVVKELKVAGRPLKKETFTEDASATKEEGRQSLPDKGVEAVAKKMYVLEFEENGDSGHDQRSDDARKLKEELMSDQGSFEGKTGKSVKGRKRPSQLGKKQTEDPIRLEIQAQQRKIRQEYLQQEQEKALNTKKHTNIHYYMFGASLLILGIFIILWANRGKPK